MRKTVLVVEDEATIRQSLEELLELEGYQAVCAAGGDEALSLLRKMAPPSLVLVDLMMPEVSGWDLIQAMRADPRTASIPVVILSAVGKMLATPPGVAAVLHKPVNAKMLVDTIVAHTRD